MNSGQKQDLIVDALIALKRLEEFLTGPDLERIQGEKLFLEKLLREV